MNINDVFTSQFLRAADLKGRKVEVEIESVDFVEVGPKKEHKLAMYFVGKEKGMIVNKTNANIIAAEHGPETERWIGKKVILYPAKVEFQGQMTDALRVELPVQFAATDEDLPPF